MFFKTDKLKKVFNWTLVLFWMIIIFWSSSISSYPVDFTKNEYDIVSSSVHLFFYVVLSWLLIRALTGSKIKINQALVVGFLITIVFGAFDEWHQSFVPGREMHFSDWFLDVVGSLVVCIFYTIKFRLKNKPYVRV